jgi:light-regulated signal transduction histidine kinase (bacteriophytochrome)
MLALPVTFQTRTACAYLSTLISTHLENMINKQRFDQTHQVRQLAEQYWNGSHIHPQSPTTTTQPDIAKDQTPHADENMDSPEDEYCSSCDERDYFDKTVAERLENMDIDIHSVKQKISHSSANASRKTRKFRRRADHDRRSTEDWARMYERFVRVSGPTVCQLFGADYMLFMIQGRSIVNPNPALIPDPDALTRFAQYLQSVRLKKTIVSNCIVKDFEGMESTRGLSGAIYLPLSDDGIDFAVFCRQEQVMNVTWAVSNFVVNEESVSLRTHFYCQC